MTKTIKRHPRAAGILFGLAFVVLLGILPVLSRGSVTAPSGQLVDEKSLISKVTPTITANSAYSSGQCLGGVMTFSTASNNHQVAAGRVGAAALVDGDSQGVEVELWLFSQTIAGTATDHAAFNPSLADLENLLGIVDFATADYGLTSARSVCFEGNLWIPFNTDLTGTGNIYGVLVVRGTPTYTATNNIRCHLQFLQELR